MLCRQTAAEAIQRYAYQDAVAHLEAAVQAAANQLEPIRRRDHDGAGRRPRAAVPTTLPPTSPGRGSSAGSFSAAS